MERSHILPGEKENRLLKVNLCHLKDSFCPLKKVVLFPTKDWKNLFT